jgi:hypothetical protein
VILGVTAPPVGAPRAITAAPAPQASVASAPLLALVTSVSPETVATPARVQSELPVTFAPAAECTGVSGTWRGRAYSSPHEAYYDFTLQVRERGSAVQGTVVAELWSGSTDEVDPPQACSGAQHVKVLESGSGTVDDSGTMHFASKTWRVNNHLCGRRRLLAGPVRRPRSAGRCEQRRRAQRRRGVGLGSPGEAHARQLPLSAASGP